MTDKTPADPGAYRLADPARLAQNMAQVFEQASKIARTLAERPDLQRKEQESQVTPVEQVMATLSQVMQSYMADPQRLMDAQMKLWASYGSLWQNAWARFLGQPAETVASPPRADRRFADKDWQENTIFDFLKQFYLVSASWAVEMVNEAQGLDDHTRHKARFYVENIVNALSPSNFIVSNPEVLRLTLATNGENLIEGMKHLERDFQNPEGRLRIRQTDLSAFEIGRNIAMTPGKVVFRNELFELIHYAPTTAEQFAIPLLIMPPWINKFYILDLNEKKSFVRWATAQGLSVFIMSWVNAGEAEAGKNFTDYMKEGFLTAVSKVCEATGSDTVNTIGYCIGGTMLTAALGYMAAKGDNRVNSATLFTTQVDFELAGDLKVYVDDEQVRWIEERMEGKGYLPGTRMADAFNLLRSNDLIWSFVVNNYMLGREPMAFDLLYWNSDSTRMPAGGHSFYLRETYMKNSLAQGQLMLDGVQIDLKKVTVPVYNLATREDHIAPAPSVFRVGRFLGGETRLVVSGSGHIAGVINPPEMKKYQYWTNDEAAETLEDWMKGARENPGSWWPDWFAWISQRSGGKVPARVPGEGGLAAIGDAPGDYVKARSE